MRLIPPSKYTPHTSSQGYDPPQAATFPLEDLPRPPARKEEEGEEEQEEKKAREKRIYRYRLTCHLSGSHRAPLQRALFLHETRPFLPQAKTQISAAALITTERRERDDGREVQTRITLSGT